LVDLRLFFRIRSAFEKRYPEVQFQFVAGLATELAEWVMRSDLHAGLIELPIRCRGLAVLNVFREPLLLALQKDDKLATAKSILPRQLKNRTLVLLSSAADLAHDKISEGLRAWGYRPEKTLDVISLAQAFDFVASGEEVSVVRANAARFESKKIVLQSLPGLPMLDTGIAYRRDIRSPLVRNLLRIVHDVFAEERAQMIQSGQKS